MLRSVNLIITAFAVIASTTSAAFAAFVGPTSYLSTADSPLLGTYEYFHNETFEDGLLNTPGLSASAGNVVGPGPFTDSIDGDDGQLDGFGSAGNSWYSGNVTSVLRFTFNAAALGGFPTAAGLVWTDVGFVPGAPTGFDVVTFEAFDAGGISLGTIGPIAVGDGVATGETAEDRFFGIVDAGGISAIQLTMGASIDWEVDHVQYGRVPEPAVLSAALLGLGLMARRR